MTQSITSQRIRVTALINYFYQLSVQLLFQGIVKPAPSVVGKVDRLHVTFKTPIDPIFFFVRLTLTSNDENFYYY